MKIFITGATGFVGTYVANRLAQDSHELCCLVRKTSDTRELEKLGATLITGDITDLKSLFEGMMGCDWVINIAAIYSLWEPDRQVYKLVNIEGTKNVMECALKTSVSKVVHVSSATIFGNSLGNPLTEESPIGNIRFSEYAQTKYEGDIIAWELYKEEGLPLVMIYPGAVLGPGDPNATGTYIQDLIHRRAPATVFNDIIFPFVHVRDVAEVIVRAAEKENNIGEKYLVSKHNISFGKINQMVSDISGVTLPKLKLPNWLVSVNSILLTLLADLIKKPPLWGMSKDQIRTMKNGVMIDGSKVERDLGLKYTPIEVAIKEAIAFFQE